MSTDVGTDDDPTEDQFQAIEAETDAGRALDLVVEAWQGTFGSASEMLRAEEASIVHATKTGRYVRLATGGWSGNELLISALRGNKLAWSRTWCLTARGGLYVFKYPSEA